jgi:hypothetical protein
MPETLDYESPKPAPLGMKGHVIIVSGVVGGALTAGSILVVGFLPSIFVAIVLAMIVSSVAARASEGAEFRAGFSASAFAAITYAILGPLVMGEGIDAVRVVLGFVFGCVIFGVPGIVGSLWCWEGRLRR